MHYENTFKYSLFFSILIHSFLLYKLPQLTTTQLNKSLQEIEVSYYKLQMLKFKTEETKITPAKNSIRQNVMLVKKEKLPSPVLKEAESFFKKFSSPQKDPITIKQFSLQKKISMPEVKSDSKIKNPKYNSYYKIVRDKIRRCAYSNYTHYETGEVYLVFVVLKDGSLKDVKLVEGKTEAVPFLKAIALQSIKDASPYPAFPEELSYPELSFNVIISFEVSN